MIYNIGDLVICRVSDDGKTIFDVDYENISYRNRKTENFLVIGKKSDYYVILVDEFVQTSFEITQSSIEFNNINPKYLGKRAYLVKFTSVLGRITPDYAKMALTCLVCKNAFPYALPNQDDDKFACWSCRNTPTTRIIYNLKT